MQKRGRLIIISSPSGGGKTSVIHRFLKTHPNAVHSISCTTRPIRKGETDGGDYHHISEAEFQKGIGEGKFAEWERVHNHLYGTPVDPINRWLAEGKDVLLDLDVKGGLRLKEHYKKDSISIFILPPSIDELKKRLVGRGTDAPEVQALRLKNALAELEYQDRFDYRVTNDDLDRVCGEIEKILE